jgi:hypothetical protein
MEPEQEDEYVAYQQGQRPTLYEPAEAEALAFSLLGAAQQARAYRLNNDEGNDEVPGVCTGD